MKTRLPGGSKKGLSGVEKPIRLSTGREWDKETGLYYNHARYFDPMEGRFVSKDPSGFVDGPNLYSYTENNPINRTDPTGLSHRSGQWKSCGGGCRIRIDYDAVGTGRHLHWECRGSSGEMGEFGGTSHGGNHTNAPETIRECARRFGFQPEPNPNPQRSMCDNTCQRNIVIVGGVAIFVGVCVLYPPALIGAAAF